MHFIHTCDTSHTHISYLCVQKPVEYFVRKRDDLSKQKTCTSKASKVNEKALRASYLLAVHIAKNKKPHTIGESFIHPAAIEMCREMCGDTVADKLKATPVSNDKLHRRIMNARLAGCERTVSVQNCGMSEIFDST